MDNTFIAFIILVDVGQEKDRNSAISMKPIACASGTDGSRSGLGGALLSFSSESFLTLLLTTENIAVWGAMAPRPPRSTPAVYGNGGKTVSS